MVGKRCVWCGVRWLCTGGWAGLAGASPGPAGCRFGAVSVVTGQQPRRRVSVGGLRGVLAVRDGGWVVSNASEVAVLEALRGGDGSALGRLRALAAALNEGVAAPKDLRRLNRWLSEIAASQELWRVKVPAELCAAVASVCVCVDDERLWRWLGFVLPVRLDGCLVDGFLPAPGAESWSVPQHHWPWSFDRDAHWITELPAVFWDRLDAHRDERLRAVAAASDPTSRPKVLARLACAHRVTEVADLVASHPRTPTRTLRHLVRYPGCSRAELRAAQNRAATKGLLEGLSRSHGWQTRYAVADHPNAPKRALRRLGGDEFAVVRCAVARAPNTPASTLEALAADDEVWVRANAASNEHLPQKPLQMLVEDRYRTVRAQAVANGALCVELAAECVGDRAQGVRAAVAARPVGPDVLDVLSTDPKWTVRLAVACNSNTRPGVLEMLAGDGCDEVRAAVAGHRDTPAGTLEKLAGDDCWWVRGSLASNPSTPTETLWTLTGDEDLYVKETAAENAAMAPERLQALAVHRDWELRAAAALNPAMPQELLATLAGDDESDVRRCVCHNNNVPAAVLDALGSDPDYWVRAEAAAAHRLAKGPAARP